MLLSCDVETNYNNYENNKIINNYVTHLRKTSQDFLGTTCMHTNCDIQCSSTAKCIYVQGRYAAHTYVGPVATIGNFPAMSNPSMSEPQTSAGAVPDSIRHGKWVVFRPMALQEKTTVAVLRVVVVVPEPGCTE